MKPNRYLIVNADDFGRSAGINQGIVKAHGSGIVTSASLMVCWPAAHEAASYGLKYPELSLGLHIDMGEWTYKESAWRPVYEVVQLNDHATVAKEIERQLAQFVGLVGREPTHIDSHQHIHRSEPVCSILREMAYTLGVPLRQYTSNIHYCGLFYGQTSEGRSTSDAVSTSSLCSILMSLPAGVTELSCHPGCGNDMPPPYQDEREVEMRALCSPEVHTVIADEEIQLYSFHDFSTPRSDANILQGNEAI
jgi:predicted glycoside hydrolase/deacetylase ChbG (UPF0249 family)